MTTLFLASRILHLAGMAVFLGVLVVNARLKKVAEANGEREVLRFCDLQVRRNDARLGGPGMGALLVGGLAMAAELKGAVAQPWFYASMALMVPLFAGWMGLMLPAQKKLTRLVDPICAGRLGFSRKWDLGWWITLASTLAILVLMVAKNALF